MLSGRLSTRLLRRHVVPPSCSMLYQRAVTLNSAAAASSGIPAQMRTAAAATAHSNGSQGRATASVVAAAAIAVTCAVMMDNVVNADSVPSADTGAAAASTAASAQLAAALADRGGRGAVVVTGPEGSGKHAVVQAALNTYLAQPGHAVHWLQAVAPIGAASDDFLQQVALRLLTGGTPKDGRLSRASTKTGQLLKRAVGAQAIVPDDAAARLQRLQYLRQRLAENPGWLLVLHDVSASQWELLRPYLPLESGLVVVAASAPAAAFDGQAATTVVTAALSDAEALDLLRRTAGDGVKLSDSEANDVLLAMHNNHAAIKVFANLLRVSGASVAQLLSQHKAGPWDRRCSAPLGQPEDAILANAHGLVLDYFVRIKKRHGSAANWVGYPVASLEERLMAIIHLLTAAGGSVPLQLAKDVFLGGLPDVDPALFDTVLSNVANVGLVTLQASESVSLDVHAQRMVERLLQHAPTEARWWLYPQRQDDMFEQLILRVSKSSLPRSQVNEIVRRISRAWSASWTVLGDSPQSPAVTWTLGTGLAPKLGSETARVIDMIAASFDASRADDAVTLLLLLAQSAIDRSDRQAASAFLTRARTLLQPHLQEQDNTLVASLLSFEARVAYSAFEFRTARALSRQALAMKTAAFGRLAYPVALEKCHLALYHAGDRQWTFGLPQSIAAYKAIDLVFAEDDRRRVPIVMLAGAMSGMSTDFSGSEEYLNSALTVAAPAYGDESPMTMQLTMLRAHLGMWCNSFDKARKYAQQAVDGMTALYGPNSTALLSPLHVLFEAQLASGAHMDAIDTAARLVKIARRVDDPSGLTLGQCLIDRALALDLSGERESVVNLCNQAVEVMSHMTAAEPWTFSLIPRVFDIAHDLLKNSRQWDAAARALLVGLDAIDVLAPSMPVEHARWKERFYVRLAMVYRNAGNTAAALAAEQKRAQAAVVLEDLKDATYTPFDPKPVKEE